MFKCAAGHNTELYEDQVVVTLKIRETDNTHYIHRGKSYNDQIVESYGYEIVQQAAFCFEHAQLIGPPEKVGTVYKKHYFKAPERDDYNPPE